MKALIRLRLIAAKALSEGSSVKMITVFWIMTGMALLLVSVLFAVAAHAWDVYFDLQPYGYVSEIGYALTMAITHTAILVSYVAILFAVVWLLRRMEEDDEEFAASDPLTVAK